MAIVVGRARSFALQHHVHPPGSNGSASVAAAIGFPEIAQRLEHRLPDLIGRMLDEMATEIPEYQPAAASSFRRDMEAAVEATAHVVISLIGTGRGVSDSERHQLQAVGSRRARDGLPVTSVLAAFRVAMRVGWALTVAEITEAASSAVEAGQASGAIGQRLFEFLIEAESAVRTGHERASMHVEARGRAALEVFEDVLGGNFGSEREIVDRALAVGYDLRMPSGLILVVDPQRTARSRIKAASRELCGQLRGVVELRVPTTPMPHVALIVPPTADGSWVGILAKAKAVARRYSVVLVADGELTGPRSLHHSYRTCSAAIPITLGVFSAGSVVQATEPMLYRALIGKSADRQEFMRRILQPLLDLQPASRDRLLGTLEEFSDRGWNQKVTSAALGIHGKTMSKRLSAVQRLTGLSPDRDRFAIELAIRLWKVSRGDTKEGLESIHQR